MNNGRVFIPAEYLKSHRSRICVVYIENHFLHSLHSTHTHKQTTRHPECALILATVDFSSFHRFFLALRFVCETLSTIIIVAVNAARNEAKEEKKREYFTHCNSGEMKEKKYAMHRLQSAHTLCCVWVVLGKNGFSRQMHTSACRCVCVCVCAALLRC